MNEWKKIPDPFKVDLPNGDYLVKSPDGQEVAVRLLAGMWFVANSKNLLWFRPEEYKEIG